MKNKDMRWVQRLDNFKKAFVQLEEAVNLYKQRELSNLEKQGMIQAFEYTYELAWNTLKDFLEDKGNKDIYGSKDAIKIGFKLGLIENGEKWMQMIKSRNLSSHTYDETTANDINAIVSEVYFKEFQTLIQTFDTLQAKEGGNV